MKELVFIHFGECGSRIGCDLWPLFAKEHGLDNNNILMENSSNNCINNLSCLYDESIRVENNYHPRCLFIDSDPMMQTKLTNQQFKKENIIYGEEDASCNFGKGYCSAYKTSDYVKERVRKMIERCDSIEQILITHSIGGGTGSGLASYLLYHLQEFKVPMSSFTVLPTSTYSTSIIEPYNSIIALHYIYDRLKCIFSFDNCSLLNACLANGIKNPNFNDMNHLISQSISALTSQIRFSNEGSLDNVCDTLVAGCYETNIISNSFLNVHTGNELDTKDLSNYSSLNNHHYTASGISLAVNISMRGDFSNNYAISLSENLKNNLASGAFQHHVSKKAPENIHTNFKFENVMHIANNTSSIASYLRILAKKFDLMYAKRAFVHWIVGEGLEERGFSEARYHLENTIEHYSSFTHSDSPLSSND